MGIQVGDTLPPATFSYVPYSPELDDSSACGVPAKLQTDEWKGKKVVLIGVPGAFTPTCHVNHLPGFFQKYQEFQAKGVDVVAVIATNDAFVMSAWGRTVGAKDKIIFLSDPNAKFASDLDLTLDLSKMGFGLRATRFAIILDDLKVTYIDSDEPSKVSRSSAETVLAHL